MALSCAALRQKIWEPMDRLAAPLFQMLKCLKGETKKVGRHSTTLPREEVSERSLRRASLEMELKAFFMSINDSKVIV